MKQVHYWIEREREREVWRINKLVSYVQTHTDTDTDKPFVRSIEKNFFLDKMVGCARFRWSFSIEYLFDLNKFFSRFFPFIFGFLFVWIKATFLCWLFGQPMTQNGWSNNNKCWNQIQHRMDASIDGQTDRQTN